MTREEFRSLAQDYASGAMTAEERAAFEAELPAAIARGWSEDFAEAIDSAALLVRALPPEQVGGHVWQAIQEEIGNAPVRQRRASWVWIAASVLALAMVSWKYRALQLDRAQTQEALTRTTERCTTDMSTLRAELAHAKQQQTDAEQAVALVADARTRVVTLAGTADATALTARVLWNEAAHRGVVVASGPSASAGKDYELWVIRGDKKIPAGLIHPIDGHAYAQLDAALVATGADVLAITLEAAGGAAQPAGPIILVGKI